MLFHSRWLLPLFLVASCAPSPGGPSSEEAVLLVTIDTLRGDRLGCAGDPAARTPELDRLARGGVQYRTALAPTPITLPSHATIHSGRLPIEHGARDNGFFRVPGDVPLVAESFQAAGWETAAFVAAFPLARRFGLDRGFEIYRDTGGIASGGGQSTFVQRAAPLVNRDVVAWMEARAVDRRAFLWVHYFDPHAPYEAPRPYAKSVGRDTYAGEVAFTDRELRRLLRALRGHFESLRVCVTADHGESLGEHGEDTHGIFVYEATTRVPLIFRGEGAPAGSVPTGVASLEAVAATLASWCGLDPAPYAREPLAWTGEAGAREPSFLETRLPWHRLGWAPPRAFRSDRWKVIRLPRPEIYDLVNDPGETTNLHADLATREAVKELLEGLEDSRWEGRSAEPTAVDPETAAALESLGYVGGTQPSRRQEDLPDPKDGLNVLRYMDRANELFHAGQTAAARNAVGMALSIDSGHKEAWILQALIESELGSPEHALSTLERCLPLAPETLDAMVHYEAGRLLLQLGRMSEAEARFELSVGVNPLDANALYNWGLAAYRQERFQDAVDRWTRALELDPGHSSAREWLPDAQARVSR